MMSFGPFGLRQGRAHSQTISHSQLVQRLALRANTNTMRTAVPIQINQPFSNRHTFSFAFFLKYNYSNGQVFWWMVVEKPAEKKGIDFYFGKRNKREQWLTAALQKRKYKGPFLQKKKKRKVWLYITWYALCLLANTLAYIEAAHPGQLVTHTLNNTRGENKRHAARTPFLFFIFLCSARIYAPPPIKHFASYTTYTYTHHSNSFFVFVLFCLNLNAKRICEYRLKKTRQKNSIIKKEMIWKNGKRGLNNLIGDDQLPRPICLHNISYRYENRVLIIKKKIITNRMYPYYWWKADFEE